MKFALFFAFLVFGNTGLDLSAQAALLDDGTGWGPPEQRLLKSAAALQAFRTDASDPAKRLLDLALCIGVAPRYESGQKAVDMRGFVSCRTSPGGTWSNPAAFRIEGGGTFWPVIGASMDLILVATNHPTAARFGDREIVLGSPKLTTIPGPIRQDQVPLRNIYPVLLAYSQSTTGIEGISISGASIQEDSENNTLLYGKGSSNASILWGGRRGQNPAAVDLFLAALQPPDAGASEKAIAESQEQSRYTREK
jgi:hypothetical protein